MGFLIALGVLVAPLVWAIVTYNRFIGLKQHMKESWADIDVELKRRYDLIPNLVETVKGYAAHEQETLRTLIEARNRAASNHGEVDSQARDERSMMAGLARLFAVTEAHPDLKADRNFLALQKELAITEDRIAASRRFFNANVRDLNRMCKSFPTNMIAGMMGIRSGSYFDLDDAERETPRVEVTSAR